MTEWTCSRCPVLDLGAKLEPRDPRDPWRRMPKLFRLTQVLFGNAMMNHNGRTRLRIEKLFGHYCKVQRSKYGPCNTARMLRCSAILQDAVKHGTTATQPEQKYAYVTQALKQAVNDDATSEAMKHTMTRRPTPDLKMPPITFREVPSG